MSSPFHKHPVEHFVFVLDGEIEFTYRDKKLILKEKMGLGTSLDVKEVLDALAASAVSDPNADKCIHVLDELYGCEMHATHLMSSAEEIPLKQLGLNVTTDAKLPFPNAYNR